MCVRTVTVLSLQIMAAHKPCSIEVTAYRPRWSPLVIVLIVVIAVVIISLIVALAVLVAMRATPPHCEHGRVSRGRDMDQPGLFNDLTPSEMRAVRDFLLADEELGLMPADEATLNSSYIFMIDLQVRMAFQLQPSLLERLSLTNFIMIFYVLTELTTPVSGSLAR